MATASDIKNSVWGIGIQGYGYIVQGASCIKQRINIALTTSQGSDPLRPLFGTTIYKQYDKPINAAIPIIKNEIATAIKKWVSDVTVTKVTCTVNVSQLTFNVYVKDIDGDTSVIGYVYTNGVITPINNSNSSLSLAAAIPTLDPPIFGILKGYKVTIYLDGTTPFASSEVVYSKNEMQQWVNNNWGIYGTWFIQNIPSSFSNDFSSDFDVQQAQLVLNTTSYPKAAIQINIV